MALSDGHHAARGAGPRLAIDFLHFNASVVEGVDVNAGVSPASAMLALLDDGQPAESECPYSLSTLPKEWKPPTPTGDVWRRETTLGKKDIWTTVSDRVGGGAPVVLVMKIDDAFWDPVAGVVDAPSANTRASHAVLAVGVRASPDRVLVRNSWGEEWGDGGYAWLSSSYVAVRCTAVITFGGASP